MKDPQTRGSFNVISVFEIDKYAYRVENCPEGAFSLNKGKLESVLFRAWHIGAVDSE